MTTVDDDAVHGTDDSRTEQPGIYAAATSGPLGPVHIPDDRIGDQERIGDKIWFLLVAPDRQAEILGITKYSPMTWDEALASVVDARTAEDNALYGHIIRVHPQPSSEFVTLLCLPSWAHSRTYVLVDCRDFDGRLFGFLIDPWIQWSSFLLQIALPDRDNVVVIVNGVTHVRGRPLSLKQGDLVQVIEYGLAFPPFHDLGALLFDGNSWLKEPPLQFSSSFSHFWVLHDGGSRGIDADYHAITSAYGFQEFVADELRYAQYRTTLKTARPRITDAVYRGIMCKAVVLVTECLPTVPVPPGRITTPLTVVFVDLRPVLKGIDWRLFVKGEYSLDLFERGLRLDTPEGHYVHIEGGTCTTRHGVDFIHVDGCAVLTISFRENSPVVDDGGGSHSGPDHDPDTSSDSSETGSSTSGGEDSRRSRSPRRRKGPARNKGRAGGRTDSLPPLATIIAGYQCPILVVDPISLFWSASPLGYDLGQLSACLQKDLASTARHCPGRRLLKF